MNKCIALICVAVSAPLIAFGQIVDTYAFTMNLRVPRVYNNMQSLGYRKFQPQTLRGELQFIYRSDVPVSVRINNLKNITHKVNGVSVEYTCEDLDESSSPLVVALGNNKTGKFRQGAARFSFLADPSYNIGGTDEDNTLILELSGYGIIRNGLLKTLSGSVTGQIGCGCTEYGHISPTRLWYGYLTPHVSDIAPLNGRFSATFRRRTETQD